MRVGVISEGPADFAVLRNILKALLGLDAADVDSIRPELQTDRTSWHRPEAEEFSNWELVKEECEQGTSIDLYLGSGFDEARLVVVQIDTAECELSGYGVKRPDRKSPTHVADCRQAVTEAIRSWANTAHTADLALAVAVEETDAWLIPLYDTKLGEKDSGTIRDPKKRLLQVLQRTNRLSDKDRAELLRTKSELMKYTKLSEPLRKLKELGKAMEHNASLTLFVTELGAAAERIEPGFCKLARGEEPEPLP